MNLRRDGRARVQRRRRRVHGNPGTATGMPAPHFDSIREFLDYSFRPHVSFKRICDYIALEEFLLVLSAKFGERLLLVLQTGQLSSLLERINKKKNWKGRVISVGEFFLLELEIEGFAD
uniref:uncharacterized protein LOC117605527 n=1 Tax=Osmia lignaria TaxID=473952 RepID=UPI00147909AE|nr:uncharacterized protein LOC117605527 [Osmia lignaria]